MKSIDVVLHLDTVWKCQLVLNTPEGMLIPTSKNESILPIHTLLVTVS